MLAFIKTTSLSEEWIPPSGRGGSSANSTRYTHLPSSPTGRTETEVSPTPLGAGGSQLRSASGTWLVSAHYGTYHRSRVRSRLGDATIHSVLDDACNPFRRTQVHRRSKRSRDSLESVLK